MNRFLRFCLFSVLILAFFSCREVVGAVDHKYVVTFAIVDSLDTDVTVISSFVSAKYDDYSITLKPQESYTYRHELMRNIVEPDKNPLFDADSLVISAPGRDTIVFKSRDEHAPFWVEIKDREREFVVNDQLWETVFK